MIESSDCVDTPFSRSISYGIIGTEFNKYTTILLFSAYFCKFDIVSSKSLSLIIVNLSMLINDWTKSNLSEDSMFHLILSNHA